MSSECRENRDTKNPKKKSAEDPKKPNLPVHLRPKFPVTQKTSGRKTAKGRVTPSNIKSVSKEMLTDDAEATMKQSKERVDEDDEKEEKDKEKEKEKEKVKEDRREEKVREEEEDECRDGDEEDEKASKEKMPKVDQEEEEEKKKPPSKEDGKVPRGKKNRSMKQIKCSPDTSKRIRSTASTTPITPITPTTPTAPVTPTDKRYKKKGKRASRKSRKSRKVRNRTSTTSAVQNAGSGSGEKEKLSKEKEEKVPSIRKKISKDRDKKGFFKKIMDKTRFWRKSDCVAQPTPEMLIKPCVAPEYDPSNPQEFLPDPHFLFPNEEEWKLVVRNNRSAPDEVFVNRRPFWLRTSEDVVPKIKQMSISAELSLAQTTNAGPKTPRRKNFYDPLGENLDKLMAVDAQDDKEKELSKVRERTIQSTMTVHAIKKAYKKDDFPVTKDEKDKSPNQVKFSISDKPDQLNQYSRKERPKIGATRKFTIIDYSNGQKGAKRKPSKIGVEVKE